jgi:hypothetical protein
MTLNGQRYRGEDAVDPGGLQPGLDVYCGYEAGTPGYANGSYTNMDQIKSRFPGKKYLSVGRDAMDIEPGLATPDQAPGFVRQWKPVNTVLPVLYADGSEMPDVKAALNSAGIPRARYFLWLADPDGDPSIPAGYDGKQWEFDGNLYDADSFYEYMWEPVTVPIPIEKGTFPAPGGFTARGGHTSAAFTWREVPHATGYKIVIYDNPATIYQGHWLVIATMIQTAPITSHQTGGLERGQSYQAHIWALGSPVSSQHNYATAAFRTG